MIDLKTGDTLQQRYRVIKLLGKGGFGAVYLAEHVRLQGRKLALKVSFDNSRDAEDQFLFEASILANLQHVGLPTVSDSFVEPGGQLFLVMDYIEGKDLTDIIIDRQGPVKEHEAINWLSQICEAVAYLHEQPKPIIHRDIKPPNIKITPNGRAVLVDFGIAKQFTPGKRTAKIAKAFSPGFSPKEQYIGTTDTRTDVYALGATLYCLLTATIPPDAFQERFAANVPLLPIRQINPQLSPQIESVIMKAMAMEAKYRYANARQMLEALRDVQKRQSPASLGIRCPRCGHINRKGIRFCVQDGTPLTNSPPVKQSQPPSPATSSSNAITARQHNVNGLEHSKAGRISQAISAYAKAVQLNPENPVYHYNLATAYHRAGNLHDALTEAQRAESLNQQDADFSELVGRIYYDLKEYSQAITAFQRAIRHSSPKASLYGQLGEVQLEQGDVSAAFDAFLEASRLSPDNVVYLVRLASILYKADLYDEAKMLAQEAVRLEPNVASVHNLLGVILFASKDYRGAIKAQETAMNIEPSVVLYIINVAMGYLRLGQKSKAQQLLKKALTIEPNNRDVQNLLKQV